MDDTINKLNVLREVSLFEKLPATILYVIAENAQWREMNCDEVIFSAGDEPDSLYIIVAGNVLISTLEEKLTLLKENDFFGEVGLINHSQRLAAATATTEGMLLYIDQKAFDEVINEFPDVLWAIAEKVISYLRRKKSIDPRP